MGFAPAYRSRAYGVGSAPGPPSSGPGRRGIGVFRDAVAQPRGAGHGGGGGSPRELGRGSYAAMTLAPDGAEALTLAEAGFSARGFVCGNGRRS